MKNKFEIGDIVYFTLGDRVRKETIKWIREQRYFGVDLEPKYEYATTNVSYLQEKQLYRNLESLLEI